MVHGVTIYACGHERFRCPCCTPDANTLRLLVKGPCCGGPEDKVKTYEVYDHVLDGGRTEKRVRKVSKL